MKNRFQRQMGENIKPYAVFIFFFSSMLLIMSFAKLWVGTDDTFSGPDVAQMHIFEWVLWRAKTWQPRLVSDFLTAIFGKNLFVWRIGTSIVTTCMLLAVCKMVEIRDGENYGQRPYVYAVVCCSFYLIMPDTLSAAVCWYTGSFHYLWPVFFLILSVLPYYRAAVKNPVTNSWVKAIALVSSAFVAYQEQCAAVFACFGIVVFAILLITEKKVPLYLILQYAVAAINMGVYMTLGSTHIRESAELYWYPNFPMLSLSDKIFQGVNWSNYNLLNGSNVLLFLMALLLFLIARHRFISQGMRWLTAIPMIFIGLSIIPFDTLFLRVANRVDGYHLNPGRYISAIFNPTTVGPNDLNTELLSLFPAFICFAFLLYIGGIIFVIFRDKRKGVVNALLYFAALMSCYAVSLSPTIFASKYRIFFVANVLFLLLIASMTAELSVYEDFKSYKAVRAIFPALVFMAVLFAVELPFVNF